MRKRQFLLVRWVGNKGMDLGIPLKDTTRDGLSWGHSSSHSLLSTSKSFRGSPVLGHAHLRTASPTVGEAKCNEGPSRP